jgi:archaellum biogenesis ATPase FlaH
MSANENYCESALKETIMEGKSCRLYDENLVHAIMVSTGLAIVDYIKQSKSVNATDICDFVEQNAEHIIRHTLDDMDRACPDGPEPPFDAPDDDIAPSF